MWVAPGVSSTDRNDRQIGIHTIEKLIPRRAAASVVAHLQEIGAQRAADRKEPSLPRRLEIAGQQYRTTAVFEAKDEGRVVG